MTGVTRNMPPVIPVYDPGDYEMKLFSLILCSIGVHRMMRHLKPRWRKMLRDLWINKARTALVVLSLTVGVFTVSFLINVESLLRTAFEREYAAVNPSSATLIIPEGFEQDFVDAVRKMPVIAEAEGRRSVNVRLKVDANQWINLNISAVDDFGDIRIDKMQPYSGTWPPAEGEILLERSSLRMAAMPEVSPGDALIIQTANGDEATLKLAGIAYDFNRTPSAGTGVAYAFVTLDTLERLNEPIRMNDLRIIVAPLHVSLMKNTFTRLPIRSRKKQKKAGGASARSLCLNRASIHLVPCSMRSSSF